jgi:TatD DNase family protein
MTHWIDTHAHLDAPRFEADLDAVLRRAHEAGVKWIITIGADLASSRSAVALAERYEAVYATVGVHPHEARAADRSTLNEVRDLAAHPLVVAVGEIGLDYYRDLSPRHAQRAAFESQLALAGEAFKPVVVHIRDQRDCASAYDDALSILGTWTSGLSIRQSFHSPILPSPGVLHCFSGTPDAAEAALDLGFYLGVDGPVTYPNARALQAMVFGLPLERLLLETDCPYLAPQARRGKRNEPAYLPYIAEKIAELKGLSPSAVARTTTENARRLFRLSLTTSG